MITLVTTYYNEPEHLKKYIETSRYFIQNSLIKRLIVVDDGSQKIPAKDVIIKQDNISLFVVDEDLGFNSHGARNLAAKHVKTDWIFFADIDVDIPKNTLDKYILFFYKWKKKKTISKCVLYKTKRFLEVWWI